MAMQFMMSQTSFGKLLLYVPPSVQNKTSALEKVERLEKLERTGGSTLHSYACQVPKMLEMDRCHVYQRITIGLKDFLQSQFDINSNYSNLAKQ